MPPSQIMVVNEVGRLLPVSASKSQPLRLLGQIVHNRPQPEPLCPFLPAPALNQTGAAHVQFHCGALHKDQPNREHNSFSSTSLSVPSSMVHMMHGLKDEIYCYIHKYYSTSKHIHMTHIPNGFRTFLCDNFVVSIDTGICFLMNLI